jgi:folate-binding protein YgfZ
VPRSLLPVRAVLAVSGLGRFDYLQGVVTQDVAPCKEGKPVYALTLRPQGKFMADMFIVPDGERLLLDVSASHIAEVLSKLRLYGMGRDAQVAEAEGHRVFAYWGEGTAVPDGGGGGVFYPDLRHEGMGVRAILPEGAEAPGASGDIRDYRYLRIGLMVPSGDEDLYYDVSYPLDVGMERYHAVSFAKGCYVGQEVTARMYHKGQRKKALALLRTEGGTPFPDAEEGEDILLPNGETAGTLLSSERDLALGLVRDRDLLPPGSAVEAGGVLASVERTL